MNFPRYLTISEFSDKFLKIVSALFCRRCAPGRSIKKKKKIRLYLPFAVACSSHGPHGKRRTTVLRRQSRFGADGPDKHVADAFAGVGLRGGHRVHRRTDRPPADQMLSERKRSVKTV